MTLRSKILAPVAVLLLGILGAPAHAGVGDYPSPLYLAGGASTLPTMGGSYGLVGQNTVAGVPLKAENRVQLGVPALLCTATQPCTGYFDFQPSVALPVSSNDDILPFPPAAPSKRGWIVDAPGGVFIPAGTWQFTVQTKSVNSNGVAYLVVAMWKIDDAGNAVGGPILAPVTGTTNLITAANVNQTVTVGAAVGGVSLAANEHLYVQFWRRQATAYTMGGAASRVATLFAQDGVARIEHPGAVSNPSLPAQIAPAANASSASWPAALTARFDDPDGDTGSLTFQLCADAPCTTVLESSSVSGLAAGASGSWTPAARAEGSYHWRVRSRDANGTDSAWSGTRSFALDRTPPSTPWLASPGDGVAAGTMPSLSAVHNDPAGESGTVEVRACTSPAPAGTECAAAAASAQLVVGSGTAATFALPLAEGTYHWQARAVDPAGNASAWTATKTFTYDATPPDAPALEWPAPAAVTSSASGLRARFGAGDGRNGRLEFRVCADAACAEVSVAGTAAVAENGGSGTLAPVLPEGVHYWQARAVDAAGNESPWSGVRSFTFDATAPGVPELVSPRDGFVTREAPSLAARYANADGTAGAVEFRVCSDAACEAVTAGTSVSAGDGDVASYTPDVGHGDLYWQARSVDAAGNASSWTELRLVSFTTGGVGRRTDLPLEAGAPAEPLFGVMLAPVTCKTKGRLRVLVVLRDPARVSLVLVQRKKTQQAAWRRVASRKVRLAAGTRNVELPLGRPLNRGLRYELRVEVETDAVRESRALTVRMDGKPTRTSAVCGVSPS